MSFFFSAAVMEEQVMTAPNCLTLQTLLLLFHRPSACLCFRRTKMSEKYEDADD